ncbi:3-deoxy-D-manno-octulosonic acid transferase [Pseudooceanicola sediminis]|uniref:3-deoxy-D-manno-octulosonic acid transferase n=1 Tax=Pseudooceanicola sediminis TaxID=2211117 RepID=A0A399J1G4_9RHOB|nr:3-deoxy-D-manno-octulosonic acid transferase [Pseudooceanicola sediminis]KAA2316198.1 3-deoxy-D-manno-octulosonic acid transferase [Puniceibacterium sp. HSS470]RII39110.1 3-deoxy-D-manno-octulosonic acid transferase [Pseudooceanicola sediminis]|tara:strand:- start:66398 stop:67714 length:1317 start_codon:yes stop_codon:yes gene_type:complete
MTRPQAQATPFYHLYRLVAQAAMPLLWRRVSRKLGAEGITPDRQRERLGHATQARPDGTLLWFHAASVGESVSVLALVQRLLDMRPDAHALITSGTAASATVLASRLPARCQHQFAPLDAAGPVRRFFDHWQPDAGIFVESELWPQTIVAARARGIPLALLNARLSRGSLRNWRRFDETFRFLADQFCLIRTQDRATCDGLLALGARADTVAQGPNLKAMILPPPVDQDALARMRAAFPGPLWAAVSTHEGEEEQILDAHLAARTTLPGLRLILVPRHPTRADAIARLISDRGLGFARRTQGATPGTAEVYLADTLGETGLWYALAPLVFLGGSFGKAGGHTPYEPAAFATPVLHGPHVANFSETYARFDAAGAARAVSDATALATCLTQLLGDPAQIARMGAAARAISHSQGETLAQVADELLEAIALPLSAPPRTV